MELEIFLTDMCLGQMLRFTELSSPQPQTLGVKLAHLGHEINFYCLAVFS